MGETGKGNNHIYLEPNALCNYVVRFEGHCCAINRSSGLERSDDMEKRMELEMREFCRYISEVTGIGVGDIRKDIIVDVSLPPKWCLAEEGRTESDIRTNDKHFNWVYNNPKCSEPLLYGKFEPVWDVLGRDRGMHMVFKATLMEMYLDGDIEMRDDMSVKIWDRKCHPDFESYVGWLRHEFRDVTINCLAEKRKKLLKLIKKLEKAQRKLAVIEPEYQKMISNENRLCSMAVLNSWRDVDYCRTELTDYNRFDVDFVAGLNEQHGEELRALHGVYKEG